MRTKVFAEGRDRDENGWLKYPVDRGLRRAMYSEELCDAIMTHPAKQQAHLHKDICEYVSEPGETILDPFGGVGTTLISATLGRNVILVEIEDYYVGIINRCIEELQSIHNTLINDSSKPYPWQYELGRMMVVQSDNRLALPIPCDHIITSPPYGNDLYSGADKESSTAKSTRKLSTGGDKNLAKANALEMSQYAASNQNIGKLQPFIYKQAMQKVYELMVKSVKIGGTITITHRDRMKEGERILYIESIVSTLVKLGCSVVMLDKWQVPRTIQANVNINLGEEVVLDEDIIIMRRER